MHGADPGVRTAAATMCAVLAQLRIRSDTLVSRIAGLASTLGQQTPPPLRTLKGDTWAKFQGRRQVSSSYSTCGTQGGRCCGHQSDCKQAAQSCAAEAASAPRLLCVQMHRQRHVCQPAMAAPSQRRTHRWRRWASRPPSPRAPDHEEMGSKGATGDDSMSRQRHRVAGWLAGRGAVADGSPAPASCAPATSGW